ncbi:hypothetical protein D9M68_310520 [compost metagenome]
MNELILSLPGEIQAALQNHSEAKADYLSMRERLSNLAKRIDKHRKTAAAANEQSTQAGTTWRTQFRIHDGELTKEIRDLKRQELDARELAEEYTSLANELQPEFGLCQLNTDSACDAYRNARESAQRVYGDHCLVSSAAALFALPEAQLFIAALERQGLIKPTPDDGTANSRRMSVDAIEEAHAADNKRLQRLGQAVQSYIRSAKVEADNEPADAIWQALLPVVRLAEEKLPDDVNGTVGKLRLRKQLETQLGKAAPAVATNS